MNGGRIILLAVIAIVGSAGTATSQTKHFTFSIPVEVEGLLPDVFVFAYCQVYTNSTRTTLIGHGNGDGEEPIDSDGNFSGTVVVSFDAIPGKDPAAGTYYRCILRGGTGSGNQCLLMGDPDDVGGADCESKPGTELVNTLEGPIP